MKLAPHAFDVGGNGAIVQHHAGGIHELLTIFDVTRIARRGAQFAA
jgi:hypothetical protein